MNSDGENKNLSDGKNQMKAKRAEEHMKTHHLNMQHCIHKLQLHLSQAHNEELWSTIVIMHNLIDAVAAHTFFAPFFLL